MNEIVSVERFIPVMEELLKHKAFAVDTETTGLNPFLGDHLFSIIVSTKENNYYFAFDHCWEDTRLDHLGEELPEQYRLTKKNIITLFTVLDRDLVYIFMQNAKFDLHFLSKELHQSTFSSATIYDTEVLARLVFNVLPSYSLENLCNIYLDIKKDDQVKKYISKHKLFTEVDTGKKRKRKDLHFNLVPLDIIAPYGCRDGEATFKLGVKLLNKLGKNCDHQTALKKQSGRKVFENEVNTTRVFEKMERHGIKIDRDYTNEAFRHSYSIYVDECAKFEALTGIPYQDAAACFKPAFAKMGLKAGVTDKGNPSYSDENLPDNVLGNIIRACRSHYKLTFTYYRNLLDLSDSEGIIHPNFRQSGTLTGRVSCANPNLQNIPKRSDDKNKYPVRSCFVPREGFFFVMIDADQGEYRLLLDCAGEQDLIKEIKGGLCVHTATAQSMNVERPQAKTLNFALLYGTGKAHLAKMLNITLEKAEELKNLYFLKLKRVEQFMRFMKMTAKDRGWIVNIFGRRLHNARGEEYKICNHYIQGSLGDIIKQAMINCDQHLEDKKSRMLLNIHDEILFEVSYDEKAVIPDLIKCCEKAYNYKSLPLTYGCDYSETNWHEKKEYKYEKIV